MDLTKVLAQLRLELEHVDAAIASLERLQARESSRGRSAHPLLTQRRSKSSRRLSAGQPRQSERGRTNS